MAARNPEASANSDPNGFHASAPRDEPLTTTGHQPGKLVGNDAAPEFHAETLPAGTAPPEHTFKPNNIAEAPPVSGGTTAGETIGGATSQQVHTGLGHPGQGQTSAELHHDGQSHNKNPGTGLDGLKSGAQGKTVDARLPEHAGQRNLESDKAIGGTRSDVPSAEERIPDSA
ncbi:hypothetical protein KCU81_g1633, partial [Aureobasidium melanogenum]|uniref:Uncharacterized protein n=1 Tax=Aureobasidium melanogenum (strain CBS 110374) TaxID=1043003 RepID=A0A074W317_AURM1